MQMKNKVIISTLENGKIIKKLCDEPDFDYICNVLCVGAGSAGVCRCDSGSKENRSHLPDLSKPDGSTDLPDLR